MPLAECPSRRDLELFAVGQTPGERVDALAGHVEACPHCQRAIETLNAPSDTFVADLRSAGGPGAFDAEQGMDRALSAIAAIGRDPSFVVFPLPAAGEGRGEGLADSVGAGQRDQGANAPRSPAGAEDLGTIRDYRLLAKLGEGGMGAVYKALHTHLEKIVALKVLPAERMDAAAVARFRREMRAVGKLQHPNIVGAHDAGEHEGRHFLVMEHVQGSDVADVVRRHGPLAVADACEIVRQAAVGLQHAHEHGLVHRDIKPSNLMLSSPPLPLGEGRGEGAFSSLSGRGQGEGSPSVVDSLRESLPSVSGTPRESLLSPLSPRGRGVGGEGALTTVKILDLGLALLSEPPKAGGELTGTAQMMGTADYMAPEQVDDSHRVDIRADIYALGCTLYKLLTGEAPFTGPEFNTPIKKMMAHVGRPVPPVTSRRPDTPPALAALLDRLLAKSPADRPTTPAEVAALLAPFCAAADLSRLFLPLPSVGEGRGEGAASDDPSPSAPTEAHLSSALTGTDPDSPIAIEQPLVGELARRATASDEPSPLAGAASDAELNPQSTASTDGTPSELARRTSSSANWSIPPRYRLPIAIAAAAAFAFIALSIWVIIRDREGNEVARFKVPDGGSATAEDDATSKPSLPLPAAPDSSHPLPAAGEGRGEGAGNDAAQPNRRGDTPALADKEKPFVLLAPDGAVRREFKHLAGAINEMQDGETIKVHGNGPFQVGPTVVENKTLSLRAAPGYRPVFVPTKLDPAGAVWFTLRGAGLDMHGCDFRCPSGQVTIFRGGGRPWTFARCRITKGVQTAFFGNRFVVLDCDGPEVSFVDCILIDTSAYDSAACAVRGSAKVSLENSIVSLVGPVIALEGESTSVSIRLAQCTVTAVSLVCLREDLGAAQLDVQDCVLHSYSHAGIRTRLPLAELTSRVQWRGSRNLFLEGASYAGDGDIQIFHAMNLEQWRMLWGSEEEGSIEAPASKFQWQVYQPEAVEGFVRAARATGWGGAQAETLPDPGPDWSLVGPGAAYVRALEAQQPDGEELELRPEPEPDGPVVVLGAQREVLSGHLTLQAALDSAPSGDANIEIRSDDTFLAISRGSGVGRAIRIGSAPGYEPKIAGAMTGLERDSVYLEGLRFIDPIGFEGAVGLRNCAGPFVQCFLHDGPAAPIVNCRFDRVEMLNGEVAGMLIQNSVVSQLHASAGGDGASTSITSSRSLIGWPNGNGYTTGIEQRTEQGSSLQFACTDCILAGGLLVNRETTKGWQGTRNVYVQPLSPLIESLRTQFNSPEDGSVMVDPLIYDPQQWRLLPGSPGQGAGPGGRDIGADVDRIARITTADDLISPDRRAAVWALAAGARLEVFVGGEYLELEDAAKLPPTGDVRVQAIEFAEGSGVTDADLERLAGLTGLKTLGCYGLPLTDAAGPAIAQLLDLEQLSLGKTKITDAILPHLARLSRLAHLRLGETAVTADGVRNLAAALPNCTIESDHGTFGPPPADLDRQVAEFILRDGGEVRVVNRSGNTLVTANGDALVKNIDDLPESPWKISFISAGREAVLSADELKQVAQLSRLADLRLFGPSIDDEDCPTIAEMTALKRFSCMNSSVSDAGLLLLRSLTELESLHLSGDRMTGDGLAVVASMPELRDLLLDRFALTDRAMGHIGQLRGLQEFSLSNSEVSDEDFALLTGLSKLTSLGIIYTPLTDAALPHIGKLAALNTLHLEATKVTGAGLGSLTGCKNLIQLNLAGIPVNDESLGHLKEMPALRRLRLEVTPVTDAGLSTLAEMPQLRELLLQTTKVTAAGVADLHAKLPECKIVSDHGTFGPVVAEGGTPAPE